jgi:beta-glucosidase
MSPADSHPDDARPEGDAAAHEDLTNAPYRDASLPIEDRVDDLLARMTLEERLAQLGGVWSTSLVRPDAQGTVGFSDDAAHELLANGTGQITRIAASTGLRPAGVARLHNQIQRWLVEHTRLGIPAVVHEEAVAGLCARDAVQFPQAIGLASSWDRELLDQVAGHVRTEMLAIGARQALSPVLDIARDPRWGRVEETYGEDPVLAGELGVAYVQGLQSDATDGADGALRTHLHSGVIATAKHFLGYGLSDGGLNHGPVHLGERELYEVFAEPFAAAIRDAHLASVMNSYASVDGLAPAGSRALLTELLRDRLGFAGTVVADYFAVDMLVTHHRIAPTKSVAAAKALLAGLDQELPTLDCYAGLAPLFDAGIVPDAVLELSVRRVLRQKFALGLFEAPFVDDEAAPAAFGTAAGRGLARRAARESLVLLTNDGTLPLRADSLGTIAVLGPGADDPRLLEGDYHYPAHVEILYSGDDHSELVPHSTDAANDAGGAVPPGAVQPGDARLGTFAPGPYLPDLVTPLAGLRAALLGSDVQVHHAPGCSVSGSDRSGFDDAVALAATADVAVVCLAGRSGLTTDATVGEARDAVDLDPTGEQLALLRAVHATGTPTIAVVVSGRVHTLGEVEAHSAATLLAWLPGIEGGTAIAEVLLGAVAPSGRLPVSLPRHVGQLPVHYNHRAGGGRSNFWGDYTDSAAAPLHPFGHGLSTTTFGYDELDVVEGSTTEPTTISVVVTNTGSIEGDEVVQCYAGDEVASVARPVRQLVGFTRVHLAPGASTTVTFSLHPSRLAFYDEDMEFVCEPGAFRIEVGGCAGDPAVATTIDVTGDVERYRQREIVATAVTIS